MLCKSGYPKAKLSACSLGVGFGVAEAIFMLAFAWVAAFSGHGTVLVEHLATYYYGYAPTFVGGLFGALWGFVVGFIFGLLAGWFYNLCLCCCYKKCNPDEKERL